MKSVLSERTKVVVDTNIIISAFIKEDSAPAKIIEKIIEGVILNFTNKEILDEVRVVIDRKKIRSAIAVTPSKIMNIYKTISILIRPEKISDVFALKDVSDKKFIECALTVKAEFIITGDDHLLSLQEYRGIRIVTPREFLETICSHD